MKKFTQEELNNIFRLHILWLEDDKNGIRADLSNCYLQGANLSGANLSGADLRNADLRNADLKGANLRNANLSGAYLRNVNLEDANLRNADLRNANLEDAYLSGADLEGANLRNANLSGANLRNANLEDAYLRNANLEDAYLSGANLRLAIIDNTSFQNTVYAYKTLLTANFGRHTAWYFGQDFIQIGCEKHTIDTWLFNYTIIGQRNGYTNDQIRLYGKFIKQVYKTHFKTNKIPKTGGVK